MRGGDKTVGSNILQDFAKFSRESPGILCSRESRNRVCTTESKEDEKRLRDYRSVGPIGDENGRSNC